MCKSIYISGSSLLPQNGIDRKVIFLSQAYVTDIVKEKLKLKGYDIMPEVWPDYQKIEKMYVYLEKIYDKLTLEVGKKLEAIHGSNYPPAFWEIPMAPWLLYYIHIIYAIYCELNVAIERYGRDFITLLSCKFEITPFLDYPVFPSQYSRDERYVSALYNLIAKKMGIDVLEFDIPESHCNNPESNRNNKWANAFSKITLHKCNIINRVIDKYILFLPLKILQGNKVLIHQPAFNGFKNIVFASKLKASYFQKSGEIELKPKKVDREVFLTIPAEDMFVKLLVDLLPLVMPRFLLEDCMSYIVTSKKWDKYDVYYSRNHWYGDIVFRFAASLGRLKGSKVVFRQQGGGYGHYENMFLEYVERKCCDYYITWGWSDTHYPGAKTIPLPQPHLSKYKNSYKQKTETAIWVSTLTQVHMRRIQPYPNMPQMVHKYFSFKKVFLATLNSSVRNHLLYRPHIHDWGLMKTELKIINEFPEVKIENKGILLELMKSIKLFICDHQSTSFMEALMVNTPTIIFWDNQYRNRKGAEKALDLLVNADILFFDPEKAAKQVNFIWNDVQGWWMQEERQRARKQFVDSYCNVDNDCFGKWMDAFKNIFIQS